jgi:hypothetical protein
MKKLILFLIIILAMSSNAHAENVTNFWKLSGTTLSPLKSTWSVSVAGGISFGASTMSGNLAMGDFDITGADQIIGTTALSIETLSNGVLSLVPNGSGKVRIGDAYTTPLSLSTDNDSLLVTKDIEVGDTIFTGGKTMATNRGDVPWITMTTTSASPAGTAHSLPILNNGEFLMSVYSEATGTGTLQNKEVRVVALRSYGRIQPKQGTDIASATNIVIPTDGNVFELTGTTKVDLISNLGWQEGSEITLVCNESVTIDNGTATSGTNVTMKLAGGSDLSCTAGDVLKLTLLSTTAGGQAWTQSGGSIN